MSKIVRTRFAPSPTGYMHIGNLRTALYAYLYAKAQGGKFVLRIEDTDQNRYVEGATQVIYDTLSVSGMIHDEGPDKGGNYGPYIQSERKAIYKHYAEELVNKGEAYYCFCQKEENNEENETPSDYTNTCNCRNLSPEEVQRNLAEGKSFVIRQKIPLEGTTGWKDLVYGEIVVENNTLDDQILLKSDGMPTYNFANVVDDHLMEITHVIRGSEYLSSNPKYLLLYKAFGWEAPEYIHLPLICGKNEDGSVSKLSKRHGAVSFQDLVKEGYLPSAIVNYIALLGWNPGDEREIFSMEELEKAFSTEGIHKNPAVFDYKKLLWVNGEHLKKLPTEEFATQAYPYAKIEGTPLEKQWKSIASNLQSRILIYSQIPEMIAFLLQLPEYSTDLYINKKNKSTIETSIQRLLEAVNVAQKEERDWSIEILNSLYTDLSLRLGIKIGVLMWPIRIALSGQAITPGTAPEIMSWLGKEESIRRLEFGIKKLKSVVSL